MKIKPYDEPYESEFLHLGTTAFDPDPYPFISNEEPTLKYKDCDYEMELRIDGSEIKISSTVYEDEHIFIIQEFGSPSEAITFAMKMPAEFTSEWLIEEGFHIHDMNDISEEDTEEKFEKKSLFYLWWTGKLLSLVKLILTLLVAILIMKYFFKL